ncbi:DUF4236 domain-containing protein [Bradyrhizobium hipponense]|uniref:DUF4236 domain-containing protein n=2 Tax=Bradyrhizobium hipponense TaxID=2605638 RepID=A0A5S4YBP5_9BRAD|nr:DUF4236 domain-containing protein [Bradyrhizobium hipponense]
MGFLRFRRSFTIMPGIRLNLSGGGASASLGPRGLHFTIGPHGTRTTIGLPGSGVSWTDYQRYSSGNLSLPNRSIRHTADSGTDEPSSFDQSATVIDSAPIDELVANSTVHVAGALNAGRSRWRSYRMLLIVLSFFFLGAAAVAIGSAPAIPPIVALTVTAGAVIILGAVAVHGRQSSTVTLDYELSGEASERFDALKHAFDALAACRRIWRIPLERQESDWKRNAGVARTVERAQTSLTRGNPHLIQSNVDFLRIPLGKEAVYFTPDCILVVAGDAVAAVEYEDVEVVCKPTRFVEDDAAPSDTQVVGETWRYVNRNGGPDRRFNNNRKLPICLYGEIDFKSAVGLNERIQCSRVDVYEGFASAIIGMRAERA